MERELFTWSGWDQQDVGMLSFSGVKLVKQIGQFPPGTEFDGAFLNFDTGDLQLLNYDKTVKEKVMPVKEYFDFKVGITVLANVIANT